MPITYRDDLKALPCDQLIRLFTEAGWHDEKNSQWDPVFNAPFIHSTLVVSAWDGERLVGCVRVLSDTVVRSVIYDLVVETAYRKQGIATHLLKCCKSKYPGSEWLLQTEERTVPFYEKQGFTRFSEPVMYVVSPTMTGKTE